MMNWAQVYGENSQPSIDEICRFVNNKLWNELGLFLKTTYSVIPKIEYSVCSMQKGWNVKYRKCGKSLCVLYPMEGYFIALIIIGEKEKIEAEMMISGCCEYVRSLFKQTPYARGSKWLMIEVKDAAILRDVKDLIAIRAG
jgi:hypothetical protein